MEKQGDAATLDISVENLQRKKSKSTIYPAILLLGICPKGLMSYSTSTCSSVFITVLFIIARRWKQPKCFNRQVDMTYIYLEYYSAVKKKEIRIYRYMDGPRKKSYRVR